MTKLPIYLNYRQFLEKKNIITKFELNNYKIGDELVISNLNEVAYKLLNKFADDMKFRMDEMDEKIVKFYDILLHSEN